jgi:Protein of unknown function (DUF664)
VSELPAFDIHARVQAPLHGSEVAILRGSLTYQRDTLRWKCSGLTQDQLAQPFPPTDMTLGGLMKHLALVESQWFDHWFRDVGFAPPFDDFDWDADGHWEFLSARDDSPEKLRMLFDEAVRRSDAVVDDALSRGGLDVESVRTSPLTGDTFTLRWILVHMIEEYARHNRPRRLDQGVDRRPYRVSERQPRDESQAPWEEPCSALSCRGLGTLSCVHEIRQGQVAFSELPSG